MCSSCKATACSARSALMATVTLASGTLAGVRPTARIRPVSSTRAHMAFVSINAHTATFASVAHLPIFDADASIFGHPFDQAGLPLLINLHVLLFDLPGDFQER